MAKITNAIIRMYRMGTGDCFVIKFYEDTKEKYKILIDCGTWSGGKDHLIPYIENLKDYVDNHINLLIITHEHKDHVHVFDACEDLFTDELKGLTIDKIWMGWTEEERDDLVVDWQKKYGEKKKALALAANNFTTIRDNNDFQSQMALEFNGLALSAAHTLYTDALNDFNILQNSITEGVYKGGLEGMKIVKEKIAKNNIEYYKAGDFIKYIPELEGINFYVLGPPKSWDIVKIEAGGKGESYDHNKELAESEAFAAAILAKDDQTLLNEVLPFDSHFLAKDNKCLTEYIYNEEPWRKIDNDWLNSAGSLALRVSSITNNLSLALAIEFEESGKVMLFPGDAEFGSWSSWHTINWAFPCRNEKPHFTEDLLSRTVFYKVAHHLSHNGTAERLGLSMMTHPDLVAMATLDYDAIAPKWKNTMPNRALLKDLLKQTQGRLIVMNDTGLYYDTKDTVLLHDEIERVRKKMSPKDIEEFFNAFEENIFYFQFNVNGKK